jgi:regulator of replication initiation timing
MNNFKIATLLSFIIIVILTSLYFTDRNKIKKQRIEISDLEDKVKELEDKNSELESEKEELESKVAEFNTIQNSYVSPNSSYQNTSSNLYSQNNLTEIGTEYAIVVFKQSSCDYFIIENNSGYVLVEWMGGNDPDLGDKIIGSFNSFGTKEFYNKTKETKCNLWVDDYMLSKDNALEKIRDKCN